MPIAKRMTLTALAAISVLMLFGCAGGQTKKDRELAFIYNAAAQAKHPMRRPVIVVPGILGTKLVEKNTEQVVWGAFGWGALNPKSAEGTRLLSLPFLTPDNQPLEQDNLRVDGVLESFDFNLLGVPIALGAYANIIRTLGAGGYVDRDLSYPNSQQLDYGGEHFTCFQFAYDWRYSNAENARRLYEMIQGVRFFVSQQYERDFGIKNADVKVDIVTHSMGALPTRYMLRYGDATLPENGALPPVTWKGAEGVANVVMVGPPNAGSVKALQDIIQGRDTGVPFLPVYSPAIVGSFQSMYEMLPRDRHKTLRLADGSYPDSLYDAELWEQNRWGLLNPSQKPELDKLFPPDLSEPARQAILRHTLRRYLRRAQQFQAAIDVPAEPPETLALNIVAGHSVSTIETMQFRDNGTLKVTSRAPGDGSVTRRSALMDERSSNDNWSPQLRSPISFSQVLLLPEEHIGLTQNEVFTHNVLYWLLEQPSRQ